MLTLLTYPQVCSRMLTYAHVCRRVEILTISDMYGCSDETEEAVLGLYPGRGQGCHALVGGLLCFYISVSRLLFMCPHTTICVSSYYINETAEAVAGLYPAGRILYYYICVLILLYMCPHTTIYMSSYYINQHITQHKGQFQGSI